jgi:acetylornithine/succinyldiaminopimelate/putrescine aminotransferase
VLLVMDLGRSARFYNMLRIFKPRSPMSMGSWCLTVFGGLGAAAVGADLLGRGLVVNAPRPDTLRLLPPLVIDSDHVDLAVGLIGESLLGFAAA